jgi:hypothetical protein
VSKKLAMILTLVYVLGFSIFVTAQDSDNSAGASAAASNSANTRRAANIRGGNGNWPPSGRNANWPPRRRRRHVRVPRGSKNANWPPSRSSGHPR